MQSKGSGPINRVELECQVLCAALRQSCVKLDEAGIATSVRELSHLFPDLLPPSDEDYLHRANYYEVLNIRPQAGLSTIMASYFRQVRNFLKKNKLREDNPDFRKILNAGLVLRKPRLRLSHDLVIARRWLDDQDTFKATEQFIKPTFAGSPVKQEAGGWVEAGANIGAGAGAGILDVSEDSAGAGANANAGAGAGIGNEAEVGVNARIPDVSEDSAGAGAGIGIEARAGVSAGVPDISKAKAEIETELISLMEAARLITALEVQALKAQIQLAPDIPTEQLILNAGYANAAELASLGLARDLLAKKVISMAQFQVAMYDERLSGIRMAESLQVRGWLNTQVSNPLEEIN